MHKKVAVSVVGIRDYQGAEEQFEAALEKADAAATAYQRLASQSTEG
jgi:hypothetical protein